MMLKDIKNRIYTTKMWFIHKTPWKMKCKHTRLWVEPIIYKFKRCYVEKVTKTCWQNARGTILLKNQGIHTKWKSRDNLFERLVNTLAGRIFSLKEGEFVKLLAFETWSQHLSEAIDYTWCVCTQWRISHTS